MHYTAPDKWTLVVSGFGCNGNPSSIESHICTDNPGVLPNQFVSGVMTRYISPKKSEYQGHHSIRGCFILMSAKGHQEPSTRLSLLLKLLPSPRHWGPTFLTAAPSEPHPNCAFSLLIHNFFTSHPQPNFQKITRHPSKPSTNACIRITFTINYAAFVHCMHACIKG